MRSLPNQHETKTTTTTSTVRYSYSSQLLHLFGIGAKWMSSSQWFIELSDYCLAFRTALWFHKSAELVRLFLESVSGFGMMSLLRRRWLGCEAHIIACALYYLGSASGGNATTWLEEPWWKRYQLCRPHCYHTVSGSRLCCTCLAGMKHARMRDTSSVYIGMIGLLLVLFLVLWSEDYAQTEQQTDNISMYSWQKFIKTQKIQEYPALLLVSVMVALVQSVQCFELHVAI